VHVGSALTLDNLGSAELWKKMRNKIINKYFIFINYVLN
jgi:hypothetical protein